MTEFSFLSELSPLTLCFRTLQHTGSVPKPSEFCKESQKLESSTKAAS